VPLATKNEQELRSTEKKLAGRKNQGLPLRAPLWAIAFLIGVVLGVPPFRRTLTAMHDAGFTLPSTGAISRGTPGGARSIVSAEGQLMTLDPSGKFLINSITHKPVFITGDAAWSLITQLSNSDVEAYLSDRASRGFNYVWCGAADNYYQSNAPKNFYGDSPFEGPDFTNENPAYWAHVDFVIQRAAAHGITLALSPGFVGLSSSEGYLASYQASSDAVLTAYGAFLGDRYKDAPNLVWVLGGDVDPRTGVVPKLTELAKGIRSKDMVHLMIAEGQPQFAALDTFAGTTWMNLNWLYFHTTNVPSGAAINYSRSSDVPPFQGEGWYENEHSITQLQLREQGYWSVLSGAYLGNGGFGNNPVWYFNGGPNAKPGESKWQSELGSPGSQGQAYLGRLFRSREHWKLIPDFNHTIMIAGYDSRNFLSSAWEHLRSVARRTPYRLGSASSVAARTSDGQTIIAYVPNGNSATITIEMSKIVDPASQAKCWWFNPRDGSDTLIGIHSTSGIREFTPPDKNDWVLVIDSLAADLPAPDTADL
jgi:hypothetical protein